jgi:hypothetical protein
MSVVPLQKRPYDLFVSYAHLDEALVSPIVKWLEMAGLKVWYDTTSGDASRRSSDLLGRGLQSARGAIFFLSPNWVASTWCRDEHEVALTERRDSESYLVIAAQLGPLSLPTWFKLANVLDFSTFDAKSAVELLRSLDPDPPGRLDNDQDVYFSGPWSRPSDTAKQILRLMSDQGWRVIGDSPDHPNFKNATERITSIVETCRGLVAVLTYNETKPPCYTSPFIIAEVEIALRLQRPFLLFYENKVEVPGALAVGSFGGKSIPTPDDGVIDPVRRAIVALDEELARLRYSDKHAYSFLASSLDKSGEPELLQAAVEQATKLPCVRGVEMQGQHVQRAIVDRIQNASFCIADVSDDNKNSLIEAGVALGAGTPLHLLSKPPQDNSYKTRFLFQDLEMNWYSNPLERIAHGYRIARAYRRRVFPPS